MKLKSIAWLIAIWLFSCEEPFKTTDSNEIEHKNSLLNAIQFEEEREWFKINKIDTVIMYDKFYGGQIKAVHDIRIWWIKDGKIRGVNTSSIEKFKGFKLITDNLNEIKKEKTAEGIIISHTAYENLDILINNKEIRIAGDGMDISNCPIRTSVLGYFQMINEKRLTKIKETK